MPDETISFASNFEPLTSNQWRVLAENALKGADFDKALVSKTYDGIRIEPVYQRAKHAQPIARRAETGWHLVQRMDQPEVGKANKQALLDLENGANGLSLVFAGAPAAYGYGISVKNLSDLDQALDGIFPDIIHLRLEAGAGDTAAAAMLVALCDKRGIDLGKLDISLGCDPFSAAIISGTHPNRDEKIPQFADMASALEKRGFSGQIALADGRVWHAGGATEAQELAGILGAAIAYLRAFEAAGLDLETAVKRIGFAVAADADQFMTIAKIRALHLLWRRVCESCGVKDAPVHIHGETAWRMMGRRDVYVNMLRSTVATFSAAISGVDSITVLPFTTALGLPDEFARRIARNTQLVLAEESNLGKVDDPTSGSGFTEKMTNELAEKAWGLFQKIENHNGLAASLKDGWIQNDVAQTQAQRQENIAKRKDPLTGTSEFPNLSEDQVKVLGDDPPWPLETGDPLNLPAPGKGGWFEAMVAAALDGVALAQLSAPTMPGFDIAPLTPLRLGASYERLRDMADAFAKENGHAPRVFLANLGPANSFAARASWIRNLFGTGGVEALSSDSITDAAQITDAYKKSGARLACICSSDSVYEELGVETAAALNSAGADHIFLAGRPGDLGDALVQAGVNTFVYAGCDIIDILETTYAALGVCTAGDES